MNWRDKLYLFKVYAVRGYVSLVGWTFTIGTFAMVLYDNLVLNFSWIENVFQNAFVFMGVTIPIGLVLLAYLGRWDYKEGTYPKEGSAGFRNNPEWVALRKDVKELDEKMNEVLDRFLNRRSV